MGRLSSKIKLGTLLNKNLVERIAYSEMAVRYFPFCIRSYLARFPGSTFERIS